MTENTIKFTVPSDDKENMRTVISVVSRMLDVDEYMSKEKVIQSYKNALQEWCADKKRRLPPPRYETLSEDGPDHKKTFEVEVRVNSNPCGRGVGTSKRKAEQAAAKAALKVFGIC